MHNPVVAFFFSPTLDPASAQARYRALIRVLHPDAPTGDTRLCQLVNAEYDAYTAGTLIPNTQIQIPGSSAPMSRTAAILVAGRHIIDTLPAILTMSLTFTISTEQGCVIASGDTYPVKDELKRSGFRWNGTHRVWFREIIL